MPKTPAELDALLRDFLFGEWLRKAELTVEQWASFHAAIPEDWAVVIAEETGGAIAVSDWPNVIHRPRVLTRALTSVNTDEMTNFDDVVRKKFRSNAELARAVGISPALLSRARTKGDRGRALRKSVCEAIEKLTGWPAKEEKRYWPNGFVERKD
jgi:hypothetical protein